MGRYTSLRSTVLRTALLILPRAARLHRGGCRCLQRGVRRFALEDITIGGVRIPVGGRLWVSLISANRDGTHFASPASFDPHRAPAHLGFGHGIHYCLGAPLARLQGDVAITSLFHRFGRLKLAVPVTELKLVPSFHKRGLQELTVAW
jgi:cytochrome P450